MSLAVTLALLASVALGEGPAVADLCPVSGAPPLAELPDTSPARPLLLRLLTPDAITPAQGRFETGADAVAAALAPEGVRWRWSVARAGLSADGSHGFTAGYLDETGADGETVPFKFLAYWVKGAQGWQIAAFRKLPAKPGARTAPAPCLRSQEAVPGDPQAHAASLAAAEKGFSDEAQVIGLGPAFAQHGSPASLNLGQGAGLTLGADAIGAEIASGNPPPLAWGSDDVWVAPSGDLGLSWGFIRVVGDEESAQRRFPFFTVWHRAGPGAPWRYIAE